MQLKNPGVEAPKVLDFETLPHPLEFLRRGGIPGVEYLYVLGEEQAKAQEDGWSPINGVPFFRVKGLALTLMARGTPIPGAQPGSSKCRFYASNRILELIQPSEVENPSQTAKKSRQTADRTDSPVKLPLPAAANPALQK